MSERTANHVPPTADDVVSIVRGGSFNPRREAVVQRMVYQIKVEPFGRPEDGLMDEFEKMAAQKNGVDMMNI